MAKITAVPPLVIFYDCCVPWGHIKDTVSDMIPSAAHIFVRTRFRAGVCNHDPILFRHVERVLRVEFAGHRCFLVTCDRRFLRQIKEQAAFQSGMIDIVYFRQTKLQEINQDRIRKLLQEILDKICE